MKCSRCNKTVVNPVVTFTTGMKTTRVTIPENCWRNGTHRCQEKDHAESPVLGGVCGDAPRGHSRPGMKLI